MNRRDLFKLFAGVAVAGIPSVEVRARQDRIVVAGGGIIGSSIAYHLAWRGAQVTLVEKERPAAGATDKSFAWINSTFSKQPRSYYELNRLSMDAYRYLQRELDGELQIQWGGSLEWYGDPKRAEELRNEVRRHQAWGYATHLVDEEELRRLEQRLTPGPLLAASYSEQEGTLEPTDAVEVYLKKARQLGARVEYPCEVIGLDIRQGRLRAVRTTKGDFEADVFVVACGVDTPRVAAMGGIRVPLKPSPGVLAHTAPQPRLLGRVALAPGAHMKQNLDGRIVTGAGFGGSATTDASREQGERILREAARFLPPLKDAQLERVTLGWRPLPADDYPIVGFTTACPNIYVTVTHSGVTLSPLLGRLAAMEILDGVSIDLLQPYRLSRFTQS